MLQVVLLQGDLYQRRLCLGMESAVPLHVVVLQHQRLLPPEMLWAVLLQGVQLHCRLWPEVVLSQEGLHQRLLLPAVPREAVWQVVRQWRLLRSRLSRAVAWQVAR